MKYKQIANCPMCSAFLVNNKCLNCGYVKVTSQHLYLNIF